MSTDAGDSENGERHDGRQVRVGSIAADVMRLSLGHTINPERTLRRGGLPASLLADPAGYVLVCLDGAGYPTTAGRLVALDAELRGLGWRVSLLCPAGPRERQSIARACTQAMATGVRVMEVESELELLGLLQHACCMISDDPWMTDLANALAVPSLAPTGVAAKQLARNVADIMSSGGRRVALPEGFDGHAAARIAARLSDWLLARRDLHYRHFLEGAAGVPAP